MDHELMNASYKGEQVLGIPMIGINDYLSYPKHARWPIHLGIALMWQLCSAFLAEDREDILSLIGKR